MKKQIRDITEDHMVDFGKILFPCGPNHQYLDSTDDDNERFKVFISHSEKSVAISVTNSKLWFYNSQDADTLSVCPSLLYNALLFLKQKGYEI